MSFPAIYRGWCAMCDEPINIGDPIWKNDTLGEYVHDQCPDETATKTRYQGTTLDDMGY